MSAVGSLSPLHLAAHGDTSSRMRETASPLNLPPPSPRSCSYVGEWFEPKGEGGKPPVPIADQRAAAEHGLWVAVAIYAVLLIISSLSVCLHRVRGTL